MKNLKMKQIATLIIPAVVFMSCSSGMQGEKAKTEAAAEVKTLGLSETGFAIDAAKSIIEWKGTKPSGEHVGSLKIKQGNVLVKDGAIVGGKFSMDMTSIVNDDLTDAEYNTKLVDHLKSPDFFNTTEFPEANFEISEIKIYDGSPIEGTDKPTHWISGNLTIKGISKNITFPATVVMDNNIFRATTPQFNIDRAEWNIQYQSRKFFDNLKDKFIYDEVGLRISIEGGLEG